MLVRSEGFAVIAANVAEIALKEYNDHSAAESLKRELGTVQTSIKNLLRIVEKGVDTEDTSKRLIELGEQKTALQDSIAREEVKMPLVTAEKVEFFLTDLLSNVKDTPEYKKRIIDTLINKVYVFDGDDGKHRKIVVVCNTTAVPQFDITLDDVAPFADNSGSDINASGPPRKRTPPAGVLFRGGHTMWDSNARRMSIRHAKTARWAVFRAMR